MKSLLLFLLVPASALIRPGDTHATGETTTIFVSPAGCDTNTGSRDRPFATLMKAREAVRDAQKLFPRRGVTVILRSGVYRLDSSFVLGPQDSGDSLAPVEFRTIAGEEVRLTGGRDLSGFQHVSDPDILGRLDPACAGNVYQIDLPRNGIRDFGTLRPRGFGKPITPAALELFFNDVPMTLARWPNEGWATIADTIKGGRDSMFAYAGDRPNRWHGDQDIWMHGYWTWDWADSYVRVDTIDVKRKWIRSKAPHGVYGYSKGKRYAIMNVLEELDRPGEFFVDRQKGLLIFWPPGPLEGARVTASVTESPLIVLREATWITISGLTIECTRGAGVEIEGGHHNRVAGCRIRNIGTVGVSIGRLEPRIGGRIYEDPLFNADAGVHNGVQSCEISACGEGGILLCGGDRRTLTAGENYVDNCELSDCTRWVHTYRAAVFMWGVGNRVSHNRIHRLPHTAVFFWGNNHLIEYNEVFDVCRETGDAGAFYQGRDWTQRGNLIRYNYFHDLRGVQGQGGFTDVMAVYLDDFASGTTVSGNLFVNAGRSVMIGGGRDNLVEQNIFIGGRPAIHVDARGRGWAKFMIDGTNSIMYDRIRAIKYALPLYEKQYPQLSNLLKDDPGLPKGNVIRNNISMKGTWRELLDGVNDSLVVFQNNVVDQDPGFVSMETGDFRLRPDSPALKAGFKQIPLQQIGKYPDAY